MLGSAPAFSVSNFVAVFNQSLDMLYPEVVITGELANFRISKNMWVYFDLKDESASVKFFGTARALPGPLEDGMMLEVLGRPYLHPQFGFSIQVHSVKAIGTGSINKAYLLLLKKLEREGLFDDFRKRELPYAPDKIGLITSKDSAAYGDFMKILAKRWPLAKTVLFDVSVQGKDAPKQLVAAIESANQQAGELEVLAVIRGGGSKDDLASFDHEAVVRAIAASRIPIMAAIGHERDIALGEMAADARASTPSNAAELLVPDRLSELAELESKSQYIGSLVQKYSDQLVRESAEYSLALDRSIDSIYSEAVQFYQITVKLLSAYDPKQPLKRGYALPRSAVGQVIKDSREAKKLGSFFLEFKDDNIKVEARD